MKDFVNKARASWFALLFLGFLVGASTAMLQTGRQLDKLHSQIVQLQGELADRDNQISVLEKNLSTKKQAVIEKIHLTVILPPSSWANHRAVQEALEQDIKKLLNSSLGQPMNQVNPGLLQALLHKRIVSTPEGLFILKVDWLIIGPLMEVQVSAQLQE